MAYTEFTCDNLPTLAQLQAGSMRLMPDGSYAQQVVVVSAPPVGGGDFSDDFSDDFFT
jgi:hypothetical protein